MNNWISRRKNKVHKITPLVEEILDMARWCPCKKAIADTLGCSYSHVKLVTKMSKSKAHVFLNPASYDAITRRDDG
jgi:hypothetical protein